MMITPATMTTMMMNHWGKLSKILKYLSYFESHLVDSKYRACVPIKSAYTAENVYNICSKNKHCGKGRGCLQVDNQKSKGQG